MIRVAWSCFRLVFIHLLSCEICTEWTGHGDFNQASVRRRQDRGQLIVILSEARSGFEKGKEV